VARVATLARRSAMTATGTAAAGSASDTSSLVTRGVQGVVGGVAGGVAFGVMMTVMGMMPMVAMLVGSESVAVGWVVHLAISAFIGAVFGVLLAGRVSSFAVGAVLGLLYGAVWWVLGPLVIMPAQMGMPMFAVNSAAVNSLVGHLVFGLVLGTVVAALRRRA
jgi:uncharacterized membrane protein YagU involved in acid resistance